MKRTILPDTATALTWWHNNPNALKADCILIALPTGQVLKATEGQWDITIPAPLCPAAMGEGPVTFSARANGLWSRGKITSEAGFRCSSNTMQLTCIPKMGSVYPGLSLSVLNAAVNHLFDGTTVWVFTAYMPFGQYGTVEILETKFQGTITKAPKIGRVQIAFEVADPFFLLNMKVPSRIVQSACPWIFADDPTGQLGRCAVNPSNYTVSFTASSASTRSSLTASTALTQPDGYFAQGVVKCVTGANAGLSQTVKAYVSGVITVTAPWLLPVTSGDTFSVIFGCDQTPTTCAGLKQASGTAEPGNWQQRFGGMPYVPPPVNVL